MTKIHFDSELNMIVLFQWRSRRSKTKSWNVWAVWVSPTATPSVKTAKIVPPETIAVCCDQTLVPSWKWALRVIYDGTVPDLFKTNILIYDKQTLHC